MKCPMCQGEGSLFEPIIYDNIGGGETTECDLCNGEGMGSIFFRNFIFLRYIWTMYRHRKHYKKF